MVSQNCPDIFYNELDPRLTVIIVYPGSTEYDQVSSQFLKSGHAFLLHEAKVIMIDGTTVLEPWFSKEHLLVIQAHEAGHYQAGHAVAGSVSKTHIQMEKEADFIGYNLLKSGGFKEAADLHFEEYQMRYGSSPDEDASTGEIIV